MQNIISVLTAVLCIGTLASSCGSSSLKPIDPQSITLTQFAEPAEEETVAIISTSYGDIHLRFFESEMPALSKRFEDLFEQGYFTNSNVSAEQIVKKAEDTSYDGIMIQPTRKILYELRRNAAQPSVNLIHIPGAVSAELNESGEFTGNFFVVTDRTVPDSLIAEIERCGYPKKVVEKFKTEGGYPELWLKSPVFAQVYEGLDVVEEIKVSSSNGEDIIIKSVTFSTFGED